MRDREYSGKSNRGTRETVHNLAGQITHPLTHSSLAQPPHTILIFFVPSQLHLARLSLLPIPHRSLCTPEDPRLPVQRILPPRAVFRRHPPGPDDVRRVRLGPSPEQHVPVLEQLVLPRRAEGALACSSRCKHRIREGGREFWPRLLGRGRWLWENGLRGRKKEGGGGPGYSREDGSLSGPGGAGLLGHAAGGGAGLGWRKREWGGRSGARLGGPAGPCGGRSCPSHSR